MSQLHGVDNSVPPASVVMAHPFTSKGMQIKPSAGCRRGNEKRPEICLSTKDNGLNELIKDELISRWPTAVKRFASDSRAALHWPASIR